MAGSRYIDSEFTKIRDVATVQAGKRFLYYIQVDQKEWITIKRDLSDVKQASAQADRQLERMNAVGSRIQQKVLSVNELNVIKKFLNRDEELKKDGMYVIAVNGTYGNGLNPLNKNDPRNTLLADINDPDPSVWYKMTKVEGVTTLSDAIDSNGQINQPVAKKIYKALNDSGGWEALGQIIAVDLFNYNTDRFLPYQYLYNMDRDAKSPRTGAGLLKVIQNVGNVVVSSGGFFGKVKPIGMDAFDPNGSFKDEYISLESARRNDIKYTGDLLRRDKSGELEVFVKAIVQDLESILDYTMKPTAASRILEGIAKGKEKLKSVVASQMLAASGGRSAAPGTKDAFQGLFA